MDEKLDSPCSHASLIQFKEGNQFAFKQIFKSYYPSLCSFAKIFLDETAVAEDLVQDIFMKLWEDKKSRSSISNLQGYLYQSTRNSCLNYLKHKEVIQKHSKNLQLLTSDSYFHDKMLKEESYRLIHDAIQQLPVKCKDIILRSLNGSSNSEIAEDLGISVNTVKTQKKIAYSFLREKIKDPVLLYLLAILIAN